MAANFLPITVGSHFGPRGHLNFIHIDHNREFRNSLESFFGRKVTPGTNAKPNRNILRRPVLLEIIQLDLRGGEAHNRD